jgi:uncharacterized membrane protein
MLTFANTSFVLNPIRLPLAPGWSVPAQTMAVVVAVAALVIAALTALTYLVGPRMRWDRFFIVLALRLVALVIAVVLLLQPALAFFDEVVVSSRLLVLVDASTSMAVQDEFDGRSRWDQAMHLLRSDSVRAALKTLQDEQRVELIYYQGDAAVAPLEADKARPAGKRTDIGLWLHDLLNRHGAEKNLRGLVLLTDGADNGDTYSALDKAKEWRGVCPIYPFGLGTPNLGPQQLRIAFDANKIYTTPTPVYVKGKLKVKAFVNAYGFVNSNPRVHLLIDGQEKKVKTDFRPTQRTDNELEMECDAPEVPGDYKVTLKIDPLEGQVSKVNSEVSTYVTVTKEGLSVLWVEGKKRLESTWVIRQVLNRDPRFRVFYTERVKEAAPGGADKADWYKFKDHHYDVIVIGDISGSRFAGGHPEVFDKINKLVEKGTGLLVMGGYEVLGNSDWGQYKKFTELLPVSPLGKGQIKQLVRILPTPDGWAHYPMRMADNQKANDDFWRQRDRFDFLDGVSEIGPLAPGATMLATTQNDKEGVMAYRVYGKGRVVVFGADTTYQAWCREEKAFAAYQRFWNRLIRWLAYQEDQSSDIWVKLDRRRLPAGGAQRVGITVGLGGDRRDEKKEPFTFVARVKGPGQKVGKEVILAPESQSGEKQEHGYFWETKQAGEYEVVAEKVKEVNGQRVVEGTAKARFLAYAEDLENLHPEANHKLLKDLARASGGQFHVAGEHELEDFLRGLAQQTTPQSRPRGNNWPDWNREPASDTISDQVYALSSSGVLLCYFLFATCLCLEWFLRRRWHLV